MTSWLNRSYAVSCGLSGCSQALQRVLSCKGHSCCEVSGRIKQRWRQ